MLSARETLEPRPGARTSADIVREYPSRAFRGGLTDELAAVRDDIRAALGALRDIAPIAALTRHDLILVGEVIANVPAFAEAVAVALARHLGPIPSAEEIAAATVDAYSRRWAGTAQPPTA